MRVLAFVALAACGGAKAPATVGNRASPPPKPTCTDERRDTIAKHLQARWNIGPVSIVRCTPGLFPTAGFFVETDEHAGVIAADATTEIVPFAPRGQLMVATSIVECATVDLNGDGIDEIVETWRRSASGAMGSNDWLVIRRIEGDELATIRGPHTSVYHPELGGCTAEVRLAGKTIVITVAMLPGIPPSDCLTAGTHTFALESDAIIEIDVAKLSRR
jgi:hypothetical protein